MRIRPARPDDTSTIFDLLTRRSRAAFGTSQVTVAQVEHALALDGTDAFVAEADGVVGYAALDAAHAVDVAAADDEANDALLATVLGRARERGFGRVQATVVPEDRPFDALVRRGGFAPHAELLRMWRELDGEVPEPRWPGDVRVRTYQDDDGRAVHALLDDGYSGWDRAYEPRRHDDWLRFMTDHDEFDPSLWFLVECDGELVACALHWLPQGGRGWLKDVVVRPDARGRGLARALVQEGLRASGARGAERVGLKVDAANPTGALELYRRIGFVTDRRYVTWARKP